MLCGREGNRTYMSGVALAMRHRL